MNCKIESSSALSVWQYTNITPNHPTLEIFCSTVPRLMLVGILGTEQPLLLDTKCTDDTQVFQELPSGSPDAERQQPC